MLHRYCSSVVSNLGPPDVLALQLPEILAGTAGSEGFWELQSRNIGGPRFENQSTSIPSIQKTKMFAQWINSYGQKEGNSALTLRTNAPAFTQIYLLRIHKLSFHARTYMSMTARDQLNNGETRKLFFKGLLGV